MRVCIIISAFACCLSLAAQTAELTVIAPRMQIYESASPSSRLLATLPFGSRVRCSTDSIQESLGQASLNYNETRPATYQQDNHFNPEIGTWWPVQYGSTHGYAFSAYLYDGDLSVAGPDGVELLSEFGDRKLFWEADWNWYGLYNEGGKSVIRQLKVYWIAEWSENGCMPHLVTNQPKRALFILASANAISLKNYTGGLPNTADGFEPVLYGYRQPVTANDRLLQECNLSVEWSPTQHGSDSPAIIHQVWVESTGSRRQPLLADGKTIENLFVGWYGDLDADGRLDYILGIPDFEQHYTSFQLYLSSAALPGQSVKAVSQAGIFDGMDQY